MAKKFFELNNRISRVAKEATFGPSEKYAP
jgi:hypothetical protein